MQTVYDGDAYFYLQYGGDTLDAVSTIDTYLLNPPTKYFVQFEVGQNAGLVDGVKLTGQTSGAVIIVKRVVIAQGAVGTSDAQGVLLYDRISGTVSAGENLRVSTTTYCVATTGQLETPMGQPARALSISCETNSVRFCFNGDTPTNSAGTPASHGHLIRANENMTVVGYSNVRNFKMMNAVSTSNGVINVTIHY